MNVEIKNGVWSMLLESEHAHQAQVKKVGAMGEE